MKITNENQLRAGATIKILNRPHSWSTVRNSGHYPLNLEYPRGFKIKRIEIDGDLKSILTEDGYGFSIGTMLAAGCELVEDFVLPKNWYVVITDDNIEDVKHWFKSESGFDRYYPLGAGFGIVDGEYISKDRYSIDTKNWSKITSEQFRKYVMNNETNPKKIVKYRVKSKFFDTLTKLVNTLGEFNVDSITHQDVLNLGVLDIWCDPIYEGSIKLPEIAGHVGRVEGDMLVYGCQSVPIILFDKSYCDLQSIRVHNVDIPQSTIEEIRKFLNTF